MMMAQKAQKEDKYNLSAKKFNMWIFIFTSFMLFAAWTSGFIVYVGGKEHGANVQMPHTLLYSTIVIFISSITLFIASRAAKASNYSKQRTYLWITLGLGLAFLGLQLYTLSIFVKLGVYFSNPNAARSFIYIFIAAHFVHIIAALLLLINTLVRSYRNIPQVKNLYNMEMTSIFWHFLDIVWIYIYVFLLLNQY